MTGGTPGGCAGRTVIEGWANGQVSIRPPKRRGLVRRPPDQATPREPTIRQAPPPAMTWAASQRASPKSPTVSPADPAAAHGAQLIAGEIRGQRVRYGFRLRSEEDRLDPIGIRGSPDVRAFAIQCSAERC